MIKLPAECAEQRTKEWYLERLGNFSASQIGKIMAMPRSKSETFTETAKGYLYAVASERMLANAVKEDDELFWEYQDTVEITGRALTWGIEMEGKARALYEKVSGDEVTETGFIMHEGFKHFGASPDGVVPEKDYGIEIKCPKPAVFVKYAAYIHDAASLKSVESQYYWQVQALIDTLQADHWVFVPYCPFMKQPIERVVIERVQEDIDAMHNRIALAEEFINTITKEEK